MMRTTAEQKKNLLSLRECKKNKNQKKRPWWWDCRHRL